MKVTKEREIWVTISIIELFSIGFYYTLSKNIFSKKVL